MIMIVKTPGSQMGSPAAADKGGEEMGFQQGQDIGLPKHYGTHRCSDTAREWVTGKEHLDAQFSSGNKGQAGTARICADMRKGRQELTLRRMRTRECEAEEGTKRWHGDRLWHIW